MNIEEDGRDSTSYETTLKKQTVKTVSTCIPLMRVKGNRRSYQYLRDILVLVQLALQVRILQA